MDEEGEWTREEALGTRRSGRDRWRSGDDPRWPAAEASPGLLDPIYGELLLRTILGRVTPSALAIEHFLVSWGMALPLVALQMSRVLGWAMIWPSLTVHVVYGAVAGTVVRRVDRARTS